MNVIESGAFIKGYPYVKKNGAWVLGVECYRNIGKTWKLGDCTQIDPPVVGTANSPTVQEGFTAVFSASCVDCDSRQWEISTNGGLDWSDLTGETGSSYTTPVTVYPDDSGNQYRLTATNGGGTTTGGAGTLTVSEEPVIPPGDMLGISGTYWTIDGTVTLLRGGTEAGEPHLYQTIYAPFGINDGVDDVMSDELNKIASNGGNYFRCTLASWAAPYASLPLVTEPPFNVYPFNGYPGNFNLTSINQDYFNRLELLLLRCTALKIIVSLELFDPWWLMMNSDTWEADGTGGDLWSNYWNPKNNTYTTGNTGLPESGYPGGTGEHDYANPEFTNPAVQEFNGQTVTYPLLLNAQKLWVNSVLDVAVKYSNVVIQVENESNEALDWERYWANFVHNRKPSLPVTSMRGDFADNGFALQDSRFQFADFSQHFWVTTDLDALWTEHVALAATGTKPINNVKIYKNPKDDSLLSIDKMFMALMAGSAGCAFHPGDDTITTVGLGTSPPALKAFDAGRWLNNNCAIANMSNVDLGSKKWKFRPAGDAFAIAGSQHIAIYVTSGTSFQFNTQELGDGNMEMRWKDVENGATSGPTTEGTSKTTDINNPFSGHRALVIMKRV